MVLRPELLPLAGYVALMVVAAITDFRRLVIPNPVTAALCVLWPLEFGATREATIVAAIESVACAAFVLAGGAILFARGVVGGGDVKLFATASLWVGPAAVPKLLLLTALLGGALAVAFLTPLGTWLSSRRRPIESPIHNRVIAFGPSTPPLWGCHCRRGFSRNDPAASSLMVKPCAAGRYSFF